MGMLLPQTGQGHEAVQDALDQCTHADVLGRPLDADEFASIAEEALAVAWRGPQFNATRNSPC